MAMSLPNSAPSYCLCHGHDDGRPMVHCDTCDNWFHFDCVKLDEDTAAEIESFSCDPCAQQTNQTTTFSWQLTDDDLTFAPRGVQAPQPQKSRIKKRVSHAATTTKQEPSPVVPIATPTFAINESDSDGDGKDDDGEYTGEHQLTRIRRGRQARHEGSDSDRSPSPEARARKRKAPTTLTSSAKRKRTLVAKSPSPLSDPVRKYCYGKLHEVIEPIFLEYRAVQDEAEVSEETARSLAAKYTAELESAIFNHNAEPDKKGAKSAGTKYKERFRMLTFNVGQSDRVALRRGIGTGDIGAMNLSEMSSADLASEQTKQDMEKAAQEALAQSILKEQTVLPRAKITHKGEEIIENNASEDLRVVREEEERERTRTHLRLRTGSILEGLESSGPLSSTVGLSSSVLGENAMEVKGGQPTSPGVIVSPSAVRPGETSPLSPNTPFISSNVVASPVQETATSPAEEKSNAPRVDSHRSQPSFDLNTLWSGAGDPPRTTGGVVGSSVPQAIDGGLEDEVAMELEDDQPGDQDFGMFLDGVEEKGTGPAAPLKSTTPPLPPPDDKFSMAPVVWSGELVMPFDPEPALINTVSVKQVGGRPLGISTAVWSALFRSTRAVIDGRVPTDRSTKYLLTTRLNANKELIAVAFEPADHSTQQFTELIKFLVKKDRHGLIFPWGQHPPSSAPGKDLYLIPLRPSQPLPEFIELLDHVQIPKRRDKDMLIGVFVLIKGKIVVPPTPVVEKPALAAPPMQQPPLQSDAISSFLSSMGGIGSLPPNLPAGVPVGVNAAPGPGVPGIFPPTQAPTPRMPYAYSQPPSASPLGVPPPTTAVPPADALNALSSSLLNMSQDQISLILKGLSMANATPPPANSNARPAPLPPTWNVAPPPANAAYSNATNGPSYNSYGSSLRSPTHPPPHRSPGRDSDYSRDRGRRSSPPLRGGRGGRPRDDWDRNRAGPRDRRSGPDYGSRPADSGWNRKRAAPPTGYGQNQ